MKKLLLSGVLLAVALATGEVRAQDWHQVHVGYGGWSWAFPLSMDHFSYFDFSADGKTLRAHRADDAAIVVPFAVAPSGKYAAGVDSIRFSKTLSEWGKNKHKVFAVHVTTDAGSDITSKDEYTRCYVSVDGMGEYPDFSGPGRIRGRGNSTWLWYPKKPYRIKLDTSSKMLGIKKNKDWVLLANYRDMTDMMNTFALQAADYMGLPFTTPTRFVELFLNGDYKGVYQLTEQVEVGGNRVAIDEAEGLLMSLDLDDGPGLSPDAGDNFWSSVYRMPVCVKSPKNLTAEQLAAVRDEFAVLEQAIKDHDYDRVAALMDIPSYIAMVQLQEYVYNVELAAPRSVYFFRDKGGKFTFGPAWDWDAGYDFSWENMTTSHRYFDSHTKTLLGTNPYKQNGSYKVPKFFTDLFASGRFARQYKARWAEISDSLFLGPWAETQRYIDGLNEAQRGKSATGASVYTSPQSREDGRWPVKGYSSATETAKLKAWLQDRLAYLDGVVAGYPDTVATVAPSAYQLVGTLTRRYELSKSGGYSQSVKVAVAKAELAALLGVAESALTGASLSLVPLNADGSEGDNTAAGTYGAWFDAGGDTADFNTGDVHVYLEGDDLFSLDCGCHPWNCSGGDVHTVTMQYRYLSETTAKAVNVAVTFTIANDGGGWW